MEVNEHLDLYMKTILNYDWWKNNIVSFSINPYNRIYISLLVILLSFYNFYNTPQRLSSKKKLFYKYHHHYLFIYVVIILINTLFVFYLVESNNIINDNPKFFITIFVTQLLILYYLYNQHNNTERTIMFDPPPKLYSYNSRIILNIIILIIILYQFIVEYNLNINNLGDNKLQTYFLNRFGGFSKEMGKKEKLIFTSGWSKLLQIIIQLYLLSITINYNPCKYNLPKSFDF
jgi:hypothetical protein